MSISPLVTFKAGLCETDTSTQPLTVIPQPKPGYIYLYTEEDLLHFCWRPRDTPLDEPELDLITVPMDCTFIAHKARHAGNSSATGATNGRIYILTFSSSGEKHFFWLQSRSQHPTHDPSWFSNRDLALGEIVNDLLQGEEVDVKQSLANVSKDQEPGDDEDETMEDVEGTAGRDDHHRSGSGGAGPGATGGDIREEGEGSREAGADGGRA